MNEIKLFNRDGAKLYLEKIKEIEPNIYEWKLVVDSKHDYVLKYCRYIGQHQIENNKINWDIIEAIDPSGGPFISLADEFEFCTLNDEDEIITKVGKIVKINSVKSIWLSERNNN